MSLIASVERYELSQSYKISSPGDDVCFVRIYPAGSRRFSMYSIASAANGTVIPKPVKTAGKILACIIGVLFLAAFLQVLISRLK